MFNPEKPVRTRDGRKARIICTDFNDARPILALVKDGFGGDGGYAYRENGEIRAFGRQSPLDLINIEEGEDG